jgi:hypothetical protein
MATEGDIHFPPGQRREKPTFEPPPWEKEQFEELSKRKKEAEAESAGAVTPEPVATQASGERPPDASLTGPEADEPEAATATVQGGEGKPLLDEKQVELLMMGLRAEEPLPEKEYQRVSLAAGVVSALIGVLITTWAVVGLSALRGNPAGWFFVLVLLIFGLGFMAGGGWLVFRALRQQGVL